MMLFPVNLPSFPITLPAEQASYASIFPWLLQVVCKGLFSLTLCCYQMSEYISVIFLLLRVVG